MQHINAVLFLEEEFLVQTCTEIFWAKSGQKMLIFPEKIGYEIIIL
jgi:hypothetical protein